MFIGSNNSLTYLEPSVKWKKICNKIGRCQNVTYQEQYEKWGVKLFDFKLSANKNTHRIIIKNGRCTYNIFSFYEVLEYINKLDGAIVLVTLESKQEENAEEASKFSIEKKFQDTCRIIEFIYTNIKFCGGYRTFDKKLLYLFKWERDNGLPKMINPNEYSWKYRLITKYLPSLVFYFNRKYISQYFNEDNTYLMLNYVNKR